MLGDLYYHGIGLIPMIYALGGVILPLLRLLTRRGAVYAAYGLAIALVTFTLSLRAFIATSQGITLVYPFGGWPPPLGIVYTVDFLSSFFGLIATSLFLLVSLYNLWYSRVIADTSWLVALLLLCMAGITGCVYTGDAFNFFVMLEVLAIASYSLVAHFKRRRWAIEASLSFAFIGALATSFFFLGVVFLYGGYGSLNLADIAAKANGVEAPALFRWSGACREGQCYGDLFLSSAMALAFMLWALTFKAGLFPNNYWLPGAYTEAPAPASALFAGMVDKVGIYGILRLFVTVFAPYGSVLLYRVAGVPFRDLVLYVLSFLGVLTGVLGALLMAFQRDVKRLLAYSSVSHVGLLFMLMVGLASNLPQEVIVLSLTAIAFHSLTHALAEPMLFMGLSALAVAVGSRKLDDMAGIGRCYPALTAAVAIGLLSLLGVAPLAGFFSKYLLFLAAAEAFSTLYAAMIVLISGISAVGYFRVLYTLLVVRGARAKAPAPLWPVSLVCAAMAALLVALGLAFSYQGLYSFMLRGFSAVASEEGVKNYISTVNAVAEALGTG